MRRLVTVATPDPSLTPRNYMKEGEPTPTSCPLTLTLLLWHTHHIQRTPQLVSRKSLPQHCWLLPVTVHPGPPFCSAMNTACPCYIQTAPRIQTEGSFPCCDSPEDNLSPFQPLPGSRFLQQHTHWTGHMTEHHRRPHSNLRAGGLAWLNG